MAAAIVPAALVYTAHAPRAVAQSRHALNPEACLQGGETLLPAGSASARLVLDFGEELVGVLSLTATVDSPTQLELVYGEDLEEALLTADPFPADHWYRQPRDILDLGAGDQIIPQPGRRAFRYVNVINRGPGHLRLRGAQMRLEHAPVSDRGWFKCSDALLNDAWAISRRTLRLCMQGFYEDGIKRDGMLWIGDYRVEFLCAHPLFADAALARRSLEMFAHCRHADGSLSAVALHAGGHLYPRIPWPAQLDRPGSLHEWVLANYCADFICGLWEYVLHTGDTALARELAPVADGVRGFLAGVDLAQATPGRTFITDAQPDHPEWWGSRAALGYQLAAAFGAAARLAHLRGDAALAQRDRQIAAARRQETIAAFGDPARAAALDDFPGRPTATRSWHAHAAAFLAGAIAPAELRALYPTLQSDARVRRPLTGFMEFYLLQAWLEAGLVREALEEMRSYYGQMLRNGATTTWELVDRRSPGLDLINPIGRSHCHGWSAAPAGLFPAKILGVTPTAPGYRTVDIRPALGDLAWAEGEVPTPHGNIRVSLQAPLTGEIALPAGITGTLHLAGHAPRPLAPGPHSF